MHTFEQRYSLASANYAKLRGREFAHLRLDAAAKNGHLARLSPRPFSRLAPRGAPS